MNTYTNLSVNTITRIVESAVEATPRSLNGGFQWRVLYPNGYGFSAVKHEFSYGHECDLWELAVLCKTENGAWKLSYDTPITDDVLGWLSEEELVAAAEEIRSLQ